jgi:hypothetical protein
MVDIKKQEVDTSGLFFWRQKREIDGDLYDTLIKCDNKEELAVVLHEKILEDFSKLGLCGNDLENFRAMRELQADYFERVCALFPLEKRDYVWDTYTLWSRGRTLIWWQWPIAWNDTSESRCAADDTQIDSKTNEDFLKMALNTKLLENQTMKDIILLYVNLSKHQHNVGRIDFTGMSAEAIAKYEKIVSDSEANDS